MFGAKYPYCNNDCAADKMEGLFLGWFAVDRRELTSGPNPRFKTRWLAFSDPAARLHGMKCSPCACGSGLLASLLTTRPPDCGWLWMHAATAATEYDGVLIDFEGLGLDQATAELDRANFNDFLTKLKPPDNKSLAVAVLPTGPFKGYDHGYIGRLPTW